MKYVTSSFIANEDGKGAKLIPDFTIDKNLLEHISLDPKHRFLINPVIANKCNGSVLLAQAENDIADDVAKYAMLNLWHDCTGGISSNNIDKIKTFAGLDALKYLLETTSGLHSVTYGDTQVTAQVLSALKDSSYAKNYTDLQNLIRQTDARVWKETNTRNGNTSIERNLVECVRRDGLDEITLIGHSNSEHSSGRLIAKALADKKIKANVFNRSEVVEQLPQHDYFPLSEIKAFGNKYDAIIALEANDQTKPLIRDIQNNFGNIYDISSPSVFEDGLRDDQRYLGIFDFQKIADDTIDERKKDSHKVGTIIDESIENFQRRDVNKVNIRSTVEKFIRPEDILFINSNCGNKSNDVDIYCVKNSSGSETHAFPTEDGEWVEVFADSLENARYKIETKDALGMNLMHMLPFYSGDKQLHDELCEEISQEKKNYQPLEHEMKNLAYRIRISNGKIDPKNHEWANRNMGQAIVYPFMNLLLGKYGEFPSSPKNWINQLKGAMPPEDFNELECLFDGQFDYERINALVEKHVPPLGEIDLEYPGLTRGSRVEGGYIEPKRDEDGLDGLSVFSNERRGVQYEI